MIGKAHLLWDKYIDFVNKENECSDNRQPGWYVSVRNSLPNEIEHTIWKNYKKTGEGSIYPLCRIQDDLVEEVKEHQEYLETMGLEWNLLYHEDGAALIQSGELTVGVPEHVVICQEYKNLDHYTIAQLKGTAKSEFSLMKQDDLSRSDLKGKMQQKQEEIREKEEALKKIQEEKNAELERIRMELEEKYAAQMQLIEEKKAEVERQKTQLEQQMFLLDTELYSIRCLMGETVDFVALLTGEYSSMKEPLVFFQKVRYLDEELGKWLSIYGVDGNDTACFEEVLKQRSDLRELFAPGPKSISIVKISKNGTSYGANEWVSNTLDIYQKYHGQQIGILVRDGENLWIGWTDEDRIQIQDGNAFFKPETKEETVDEALRRVDTKEEKASRYFVFSILQGLIQNGRLFKLPENVNILKPNPYIILSMADGWLEDNRYGTFADIVARTDAPLAEGDMILTTILITRDDTGLGNIWNNGRTTRYDAWNNNRGRGERNRTHDARIPNRAVMPVNVIDLEETYDVHLKKYRLEVEEVPVKSIKTGSSTITQFRNETRKTDEYIGEEVHHLEVKNHKLYGRVPVKGMDPEEILRTAATYGYIRPDAELILIDRQKSYYTVYDHTEYAGVEKTCYVSAKKSESYFGKVSYANMEIRPNEYLNLTYLNSIYLIYAIQNRKIGGWKRGNMTVDYADSLPYLHTALEYIREREKEEAGMLEKYMELYDGWQVDVSEWRLKYNFHRLTDARAKKFAKGKNKTGV